MYSEYYIWHNAAITEAPAIAVSPNIADDEHELPIANYE
jgi:hypothetical protein